jgi:hypothetical protein
MSVGGPHAELEGYNDAMREQPRWTCKAKRTADPPQDCNWPFCGCDPYANKVIDTIEESGIKVTPLDEWQSIDTAPKDGTWILGWSQSDSAPYRISWGRNHNNELAWCTSFASFVSGYITHWAPLIPPVAVHG